MTVVTIHCNFRAQENKNQSVSTFYSCICHEVMELTVMILGFHILSFKPAFSLSSFTFIKRLISSSLSALRVVSSAYMRLLIFLQAILIPAYDSSSLAFHISAYKLNKQSDSIQPWCLIQVSQQTGKMAWHSHPFKNLPQFFVIHIVKDFSIVSEADIFSGISAWSNGSWQFNIWFFCLF